MNIESHICAVNQVKTTVTALTFVGMETTRVQNQLQVVATSTNFEHHLFREDALIHFTLPLSDMTGEVITYSLKTRFPLTAPITIVTFGGKPTSPHCSL